MTFPVRFPKRPLGREISFGNVKADPGSRHCIDPPCARTLNGNLNGCLNENLNAPAQCGFFGPFRPELRALPG